MNLSEFKAWFEGFTEGLEGPPDTKQWARIQEKIGKIKDAPPTERTVFVDHWARPWRRWYEVPHWTELSWRAGDQQPQNAVGDADLDKTLRARAALGRASASSGGPSYQSADFDSGTAFRDLGRIEARSLAR